MHTQTDTIQTVPNCRSKYPTAGNLRQWADLHAQKNPPTDQANLRSYKMSLTAALPHAVMRGGRSAAHVVELARRVQVDIDPGPNPSLPDVLPQVVDRLLEFPSVELVGVSASGRGVYAFVRTAEPHSRELAERVCDAVELHLAEFGLILDRVNSVSPAALRFVGEKAHLVASPAAFY